MRLARLTAFVLSLLGLLVTRVPTSAQTATRSPEQQLSRGITLFATDNPTSETEKLLTSVLKVRPPTTPEGEAALYYLGRYYHRNHYMLRQPGALDRAADRYRDLHNRTEKSRRPSTWYAEARFYKSLVHVEQAKWKDSLEACNNLEVKLDKSAEIDYLVWSINKQPINIGLPPTRLKLLCLDVLNRFSVNKKREGVPDNKAVAAIVAALASAFQREKISRR